MLNSVKASIKDTLIFGFGNVAVKIVGFVLIPLYTNPEYFSVDDFGIMGVLDISGLILISIFASSLPQSLTRWYWTKKESNYQKGIFFMSVISQVFLSLAFCLLLIPFSGKLSELIFRQTDWSFAITLLIISSALQGINNIVNTLLRLQGKSLVFTVTNLGKLLLVLCLTIYFIIFRNMGIAGIYLAQVTGNLIVILVLLPYTIKNCSISFQVAEWKSMIAYGIPLIFAGFTGVLFNVIDRYSLNSLALLKYVAIYTLAYKLSSSLKLVLVDTIKLAIFPRMTRKLDSTENQRFYSKAMLYSSFVVMFGIIGISLFSTEIIKFLAKTPDLWGAYVLVPFLCIANFFLNMREVSIYGLIVARKTKRISLIVIVSTAVNISLNLILIPVWNAMGAAIATLISQFFYWITMHYIAQKSYFVPYENRKLFLIFFTGTILAFSGFLLNDFGLIPRLLIKMALIMTFPFILYFLNFYEKVELQAIKGFITKWSNITKFGENLKTLKGIQDDI